MCILSIIKPFDRQAPLSCPHTYVCSVNYRIWEGLGFSKAGRIPCAGRLRRKEEDGGGEEYVDAWVIYRSFEEGS